MSPNTRILIVDDSSAVRADLRTLLNLLDGMEVVGEAASGTSAVQQAWALKPDLILMDLEMPSFLPDEAGHQEIDGYAAIHWIKVRQPGIGIFVLTVHGYPQAEQTAIRCGADAFFVKGRDGDQLLEMIRNFRPG